MTGSTSVLSRDAGRSQVAGPGGAVDPRQERLAAYAAHTLLAGLTAATLAQGGFYPAGRLPLLVALSTAFVLALRIRPLRGSDLRTLAILAACGLAAWALVRGTLTAVPLAGTGSALLLTGVVSLLLVGQRLTVDASRVLVHGLLALGVLVAMLGWAGVAWHFGAWAVTQDGMWRASSSLTYPNATACLLVMLLLVALGHACADPAARVPAVVAALLLVGVAATLSRAAAAALVVGWGVLALLTGWRQVVRSSVAPAVGAAIAMLGLLPSVPLGSPLRPLPALLALAIGAMATARLAPARWPPARTLVVAGCLGLCLLAWGASSPTAEALRARALTGPSARLDAHAAALSLLSQEPVVGVGPGSGLLDLSRVGPSETVMRYVHDEYVQVLLELGAVGLALLLVFVVGLLQVAWRGVRQPARHVCGPAAFAALSALLVHSGFDFVLHIPVVALTAAALVAVDLPPAGRVTS